ncbi:MAG: MFS transporter [Acidobacteriales bacterium]|nr:MFS transporter [Terriglobales bacterium]
MPGTASNVSQTQLFAAMAPLREPMFCKLWIAAVISYTGTWMQNVGAGWYMTSLTDSAVMVSLVQVAMSLPVFLVALPAGALADILDRRKLLLLTQWWMVTAAAALGVLAILGALNPWTLLLFTFLLGLGAVMNDPAWQAITPEIVSHERFAAAVALNSAGFNIARAVGPAVGGFIVSLAGAGVVFLLNAASFLGVIFFLYRWKNVPHPARQRMLRIREALAGGILHLRESKPVQSVLVRTGLFSIFASALWALLPLVAKPYGARGYGILVGSFGVGALAGAALLPVFRHRFSINKVFVLATLLYAGAVLVLGRADGLVLHSLVLLCAGVGWITILASLNVSAQTMAPAAVRARALSMYVLVLQGGMAAGSAFWGTIAGQAGMEVAFVVSSVGLVAGLITIGHFRLEVRKLELQPIAVHEEI